LYRDSGWWYPSWVTIWFNKTFTTTTTTTTTDSSECVVIIISWFQF
jgi:hypothetical protein